MTPSGIEPAAFRLVRQCQCTYIRHVISQTRRRISIKFDIVDKNDQINFTSHFFWNMMSRHWEMGWRHFDTNMLLERAGNGLHCEPASYRKEQLLRLHVFCIYLPYNYIFSFSLCPADRIPEGRCFPCLPDLPGGTPSPLCNGYIVFPFVARLWVGGAASLPLPCACTGMWPIFLYVYIFEI
jgi:hypothetical protein